MTRRILPHLLSLAMLTAAAPAAAQTEQTSAARAEALFEAAMKMMDKGEHAPACALLEQSERLDPGMGTRFRLAECYEKTGRLASAWTLYNDVAVAAKMAQSADREKFALQRAEAIEPKLSRVVVNVPSHIGTLLDVEVKRDKKPILRDAWGTPVPVDLGEHTIEVTARGRQPWRGTVVVDQPGQTFDVDVPELAIADTPPPPEPVAPPPEEPGIVWSNQRLIAAAAAGVGGIGIILTAAFGATAASTWGDATKQCDGGSHNRCSPQAIALGEDASTAATVSTVSFLIGVAGLGAGAYLWFTAPVDEPQKTGWQVAPAVGPDGVGGVLRARF